MSHKIYCDRCNTELPFEGNGIFEHLHPNLELTPMFRISIEFYQRLANKKADLCQPCCLELARQRIGELQP